MSIRKRKAGEVEMYEEPKSHLEAAHSTAESMGQEEDVPDVDFVNSEDDLTAAIEQVCHSKAEEFHLMGYEQVTGVDIWLCVSQKYKQIPPLHRVINDVLTLKTNVFMNWLLIRTYTQADDSAFTRK